MAAGVERARLPSDVTVAPTAIVDTALEQIYPISPSGREVLTLLLEGRTFSEVADRIAADHRLAPERAERHVREFAYQLNHTDLLNVDPGGLRRETLQVAHTLALAALARRLPRLRRHRYPLRNRSFLPLQVDVARGILVGLWPCWALLAAIYCVGLLASPGRIAALSFVPALLVATVIHESGHAFAVGRRGGGAFLSIVGMSVRVMHSPRYSGFFVHAAGSGFAVGCGLLCLAVAYLSGAGAFAIASGPFLVNALALTVLSADGRQLVVGPWERES